MDTENITTEQQEAIRYFSCLIVDAKLAYILFKSIYLSRSSEVVGEDLQKNYFWIEQRYGMFFTLIEHCAMVTFVTKLYHCFEKKDQSVTLKCLSLDRFNQFVVENGSFINKIKDVRDKIIAHRDKDDVSKELPSFDKIDLFFCRLENFFDSLASELASLKILRGQDIDLRASLDMALQDLFVGQKNRLLNIELKYKWMENKNNIGRTDLI